MKVFVSYSVADVALLRQVIATIKAGGDEPLCWETSKVLGQESWPSIFQWIDASDLVVVIITDKTVSRAMSVGQEVGRARAKEKIIVPLVSAEVKSSDLGCLNGVIYEPINRKNPGRALKAMRRAILSLKLKRAEQQKQVVTFAGLLGAIWLLSAG